MKTIIIVVYLVIGVAVAATKDYLGDVGSIGDILNLLLAILLWPLVLLGVDFNLKIGDGDDKNGDNKKKGALVMVGPALVYARSVLRSKLTRVPHNKTGSPPSTSGHTV